MCGCCDLSAGLRSVILSSFYKAAVSWLCYRYFRFMSSVTRPERGECLRVNQAGHFTLHVEAILGSWWAATVSGLTVVKWQPGSWPSIKKLHVIRHFNNAKHIAFVKQDSSMAPKKVLYL